LELARIGLEAGPLSQWLCKAMRDAGLPVELLETRQMHEAFKSRPVKTDRNDARRIAQLLRIGWFRPVHCKSVGAQEMRALLGARRLLESRLRDLEQTLRGTLRGFGLKLGRTTPAGFADRIASLVTNHPTLELIATSLLAAREVVRREFAALDKRVRGLARTNARARLLMSAPGVGPIVALTYVSGIDDPARFKSSKAIGAHFGLTPRKYQSGETDYDGRISKAGDKAVRTALYQAAHVILTRPVKGSDLKSWAARIAKRRSMQKAKVALARRLGVILHRMLVDGTSFAVDMPKQPLAAAAA
jgi:transposase